MKKTKRSGNKYIALSVLLSCLLLIGLSGCTDVRYGNTSSEKSGGAVDFTKKVNVQHYTGQALESAFLLQTENLYQKELPPVNERLPLHPIQINTAGKQGGTIQLPTRNDAILEFVRGSIGVFPPDTYVGVDNALRENVIDLVEKNLQGNIFSEWTANDTDTTYQFTIREGIRWSDGTLVTVSDVQFALEDIWGYWAKQSLQQGEDELYKNESDIWNWNGKVEGELPVFKCISDFSFSVTYSKPDSGLIQRMAYAKDGYLQVLLPSHFLAPFHAMYGGEKQAIAKMVEFSIVNTQTSQDHSWKYIFSILLSNRSVHFGATPLWQRGIPSLSAWVLPPEDAQTNNQATSHNTDMIRNPYYWKIDSNMQQLPYIDELWMGLDTNGRHVTPYNENDFCATIRYDKHDVSEAGIRYMTSYANSDDYFLSPLFVCTIEDMQQEIEMCNTYNVQFLPITSGTGCGLSLDVAAGDTEWQTAVRDQRFRQALSMALDRNKMVDLFRGTMEISSLAPTYDLAAAKALLAETGYTPLVVLQPWVQWLMPGSYQDEVFDWIAQSWTALGLEVQLNGVGQEWERDTEPNTYVSLCLSPDAATPMVLPSITLSQGVDDAFAQAQAA